MTLLRGLAVLREARLSRADAHTAARRPTIAGDEHAGQAFRPGDVVRDRVTGMMGHAETVQTRRVTLPASGGERR